MIAGDRWQRVRDLFEQALEEKPPDVGAWLDRLGVGDWQVREELVSLIRHHSSAGSFLVKPASDRLSDLMADDGTLEPGHNVGQYTIVRQIGHGGMGRVYLAEDARLGRRVALKALSPELTADPSHRERLRREARAAAALTHPGICTIYALEEIDGNLFIASEFIDGHTLREEMASGVRPAATDVVRTARELADALAAAHGRGITHRDLKPENVMRATDGRLKILDFGLARIEQTAAAAALSAEDRVTQPGAIIGTPAYMAPEQLNGVRADPRADVFAFGVLIYEYACGIHPFHAASPLALIGRILEGSAEPLESRRSDLPARLIAVIERCLSKSPADRFASAVEVLRALERVEPVPASRRIRTWWRAHQLVLIALYFTACALAWQVKEWLPGVTTAIFVATCVAATIGGVFRGHMVFSERVTGLEPASPGRSAATATLVVDLLVALALTADGALLAPQRPLPAVLTIALGIGIALARVVVEPTTTTATLRQPRL
ncbi:MAG: serine/threonine protein kinase [Acidobacteria bacterium]|nr:serine/threonine protein kinase [Acidobacteriota bacterium]